MTYSAKHRLAVRLAGAADAIRDLSQGVVALYISTLPHRGGGSEHMDAGDPDPIFDALRAHRVAYAQYLQARDGADLGVIEPFAKVAHAAAWALLEAPPTTSAGLAALSEYASEFVEGGGEWPEGWDQRFFATVLDASLTWKDRGL